MKSIAESIQELHKEAIGCEFAFTNLVKCYDHDNPGKFRENAMKKCVIKIFFDEIKKFNPNLIIVQACGKRANLEQWLNLKKIKEINGVEFEFEKKGRHFKQHSLVEYLLDNKKLYIIYSYHPNPQGGCYKFSDYCEILYKMIDLYYDIRND